MSSKQRIDIVNIIELQKKSVINIIKTIINEQVKIIDNAIICAHHSGSNFLTYHLPLTFAIPNINDADAQIYIYSELIKIYSNPIASGGRGLKVNIEFIAKPILHIQWINGMSDTEKADRINIIKNHTK